MSVTAQQYLEAERAAEFRNEYYNGQVHPMSGGSYAHATIFGNIGG